MENSDEHPWNVWSFAIASILLTVFTLFFSVYKFEKFNDRMNDSDINSREFSAQLTRSGQLDRVGWFATVSRLLASIRVVRVNKTEKPVHVI